MKLYLCAPEKNVNCSKRSCKAISGGDSYKQCELTSNLDCAKLDADGKPITVEVQQDADGNPVAVNAPEA